MYHSERVFGSVRYESHEEIPSTEPCLMLVFGASGDLTRRLLLPALYNLACDGLLSEHFAIIGTSRRSMTSDEFRSHMSSKEQGIGRFHTRKDFDQNAWDTLASRLHYVAGDINDLEHFKTLRNTVAQLDAEYQTNGNILFYLATAPGLFGTICDKLYQADFQAGSGWKRIVVEKPFGSDLASAQKLNKQIQAHWDESQIYRIDHYLGKETVQNLLAFRFSNGMFEPLWNSNYIDNIQFSVCESVDVEGRGEYYDSAGVLRDMMQNHMFQMLAYLCMEPPRSLDPDTIRDEKAKLLESVHIYQPDEVPEHVVRGQYGASEDKPGYRQENGINPHSNTETFAAARLFIDNWRWSGVPVYVRSGKALCKRSTEIVVQFKKAPQTLFPDTQVDDSVANRLIFHIQPYQGIELLFQAKIPGPALQLQTVDMRFNYGDIFKASRYTGYEVMIHSCTHGDSTLFSRSDLVESAWEIAQPILEYWKSAAESEFPNYTRGTWGPKAANDLIERDGRHWFEVITADILEQIPLFQNADPLLLNSAIMLLQPATAAAEDIIIKQGDPAEEMYLICRGEVEVIEDADKIVGTLSDGDFFGEIGLLMSTPRTATIKAKTLCDLFVMKRTDFVRILHDYPQFSDKIITVARKRYNLTVSRDELMASR